MLKRFNQFFTKAETLPENAKVIEGEMFVIPNPAHKLSPPNTVNPKIPDSDFSRSGYTEEELKFFDERIYHGDRILANELRKNFGDEYISAGNIFVEVWTSYLSKLVPEKDEKLIKLLKYLSSKYSLVVATNWFKDQQVSKLKLYGIYEYFDEVLTSDEYNKKPGGAMFEKACEGFDKDEVVMVGDTFKSDIKGAMDFGLYSYYLTMNDQRRSKRYKVIKSIYELKEYL